MPRFPDEIRLLILLAINAMVIGASVRFVRRRGERDPIQIALDAMLLWYLVQYLGVGIAGLLGVLSATAMLITAVAVSAILFVAPPVKELGSIAHINGRREARVVMICVAILIAFMTAVIWTQRIAPPTANDALTYHLPAAVQWVQSGRIGIFQTWFFNPANTYSPLAGSMFIAWLLAPLGNDALAQFVQAPALLMIFFATVQFCRAMKIKTTTAAIAALAVCCSRPFISQVALTKDDLFVVAFFTTALVALMGSSDRAWRVGIALGLLLSCKYTAIFCVPILLLATWKRSDWKIVIPVVLVLAGPWFLRNAILTGNPVFPMDFVFHGMFATRRAHALSSVAGAWHTLVGAYQAMPMLPAIVLIIAWIVASIVAMFRKRIAVARVAIFGPVIGIAMFVLFSPYAESRFIDSSYLLLFVASACIAPALLLVSLATSFVPGVLMQMCGVFLVALIVQLIAIELARKSRAIVALVMSLILAGAIYVYWPAHLQQRRESAITYWRITYGPIADAWSFVRTETTGTLAYANTSFVYPLFGDALDRQVIYVPVRVDVRSVADIGHLDGKIAGEDLVGRIVQRMNENANEDAWLARLQAAGTRYILVAKSGSEPPEMRFASVNPHFSRVFDNDAASVFKIDW